MARTPPPLVALSPGALTASEAPAFARRAEAAARAGCGILLREPALDDGPFLELASALREAIGRDGWLGVHDRVHVARAVEADACHLGFRSLTPADARVAAGGPRGPAIGLSTHAHDDPADWVGADYLFHGPLRETPSKAGLLEPVGLDGLRRAVDAAGERPVWALGGVRPEDVAPALDAGARGVAVLSGVLARPDPAASAAAYLEEIERWTSNVRV